MDVAKVVDFLNLVLVAFELDGEPELLNGLMEIEVVKKKKAAASDDFSSQLVFDLDLELGSLVNGVIHILDLKLVLVVITE